MSIDDEVKRRHRETLIRAVAAGDRTRIRQADLMEKSYLKPDVAAAKMEKFRRAEGDEALEAKLEDNERKNAFGRRPGSILHHSGYRKGAEEKRQQSYEARRELPEAVRAAREDEARLETVIQTYDAASPDDPAFEEWKKRRDLARQKSREKER